MVNSTNPWEQATVLFNGEEWQPGTTGELNTGQINKIEVQLPENIAQTLRFGHANGGNPQPEASPDWGTDVQRTDGKFTVQVAFDAGYSGAITLIIYSREVDTPMEVPCQVAKEKPVLRFWYESTGGEAPLPPAVVDIRLNGWSGVHMKLRYADGTGVAGVPVTLYRPEKEDFKHTTGTGGVVMVNAFTYDTVGLRTFEGIAHLPGGDVSGKLLLNVREWPWP